MTALLSACAMNTGIFATVDVACGKTVLAYSNSEVFDEKITIKATDHCSESDSEVQLLNASGTITQRFAIPDGTTKTVTLTVPRGGWVNFACNGKSGGCTYALLGE